MNENKRKLYDALSQDYDMGTFEQFSIDIDNEEKRKKLYDATSKEYDFGDFGDFDSFSKQLGYEKQTPAVEPAKPVVGKPVEVEMPQAKETPVQIEPENNFPLLDDEPNPPLYKSKEDFLQKTNRQQVAELAPKIDSLLNDAQGRQIAKKANDRKEAANKGFWANLSHALATSGGSPTGPAGGGIGHSEVPLDQEDLDIEKSITNLKAAKRSITNAQRIIAEADHNAQEGTFGKWIEQSFAGGAARGFGQKAFDIETWDMGMSEMEDAFALYAALNAYDKGQRLTDEQQMMLDSKALELATNAYFGSYVGRGYKAGQVTAESIPFMIEMCINPASAMGKSAQSKLTRYALERFGKQAIKKNTGKFVAAKVATRVAGDIAGAATMAATTGAVRTMADATERAAGHIQFDTDEDGQSAFSGHTEGEDFPTALAKSFAGTTIENYSEMFGNYFAPVLGAAGKGVSKGLDKIGLGKVNQFIDDVSMSDFGRLVSDFERHAQWNGLIGEYAEEVAGNMMNALVVGDMTFDAAEGTGVFNLDQNIDTFLGVALLGGAISSIRTVGYAGEKYNAKRKMNEADAAGAALFGEEEWTDIHNALYEGSDEATGLLSSLLTNPDISEDKKRAALNYANSVQKFKGAWKSAEKMHMEFPESIDTDLETSFDNGYSLEEPQELNDAKNMYEYQRTRLLETGDFGESFLDNPVNVIKREAFNHQNTGNQETADMLLDYLNAKATYDGMIQHVRDDIAGKIEASDKAIDSHTHSDGFVHPATLTTDRKVYVVNGTVAMQEDGKAVDRSKSDESVIICDAETGKLEFVSPHDIQIVDDAIDPVQEKKTMRQQISQTFAQEAADKIDGVLPFMPGDTYTGVDENGNPHTIAVVPNENGIYDNGDGTVNVSMDGAEPVAFPKELITAWSQQYGINRAAEFDRHRQEQRQAAREPAQTQRVYAFNDRITIKDENGNPVRGQISAPFNEEDGKYEIYTESPVNGLKSHYMTQEELDAVIVEHNGEPIEPVSPVAPDDNEVNNDGDIIPTNSETVPAEEPQSALSRIPVDEQGQQVFESAPAGDTWAAFIEMSEGDKEAAMEIASGMLTNAQDAFAKAEKASKKAAKGATPFEISQAIKARKAALETARKNVSYWQSVIGYEEAQAKAAEEEKRRERRLRMAEARRIQQQKGRYSEEDKQLGDHIDFRDYVMRTLAKGGIRLKWSDSPDGVIKGLGGHLGFKNNQSERAQRIWMLSNEDGMYPEAAAEALLQGYADTFGMTDEYAEDIAGLTTMDALGEMLDVILTHGNSHRGMFDAAAARHTDAAQDMDDYAEGLMQHNLEVEAEANGMTVEEWQQYLEVFESQMQEAYDSMSDDEFNSIFVELYLQQDYDTSRTGTGVRESVHEGQRPEGGYAGSPEMVLGEETDYSGSVYQSTEEPTEPPVFEQSGFSHVPAAETSGEFEVIDDLPEAHEYHAEETPAAAGSNNDEQRKTVGTGVADDTTRKVSRTGNRSDIRVFEEGLAAQHHDYSEYSERDRRETESERLVNIAKRNRLFVPIEETEQFGERYPKRTGESTVYIDEENRKVIKVKDPYAKSAMKAGVEAEDAIFEHIIHNLLFPETAYTFEGISEQFGEVRIILSQDFITTYGQPTKEQIAEALAARGLYPETRYSFGNDLVSVTDVEGDNVLLGEDGTVYFIDPIIRFKKPVRELIDLLNIANARADVDPNPTEAQKEAGNYRKGHVKIDGLDITIENPKGGIRKGTDKNGKEWQTEMANDYGYIRGSQSVDGDHIDIFLSDNPTEGKVYVVDQISPDTQEFDEHKVMYGFNSAEEAEAAYLANYTKGWKGLGNITEVSKEEFKKWLDSSHRKTKPFSEYSRIKAIADRLPDADARQNLSKFNVGDFVRDSYTGFIYRIKKHGRNGVTTLAILDSDGNEVSETEMNTYNNPRFGIAEAVGQTSDGITLSQIQAAIRPVTNEIVKGITLKRRGELYDELMRTLPDEMVEAIMNVRGSIDIDATYAAKKEYERRAKEKDSVPENDNSVPKQEQSVPKSADSVPNKGYSVEPAQYTTKKGKVLEMFLVKFDTDLSKDQQRAAKELAKAGKGWYDRAQGGFMMRSEESAVELAETILNNEDAVTEAQPVSMADIQALNNGDMSFTEPQQPKEKTKSDEHHPVWQYSIHVDTDGYTTISRDDISSGYPIGDARFRHSTDSPEEMLDILRNPLNGMQEVLDAVGVTLENKIKTRELDRQIKEERRREYEALRTNGINGYKIGEEVMYLGERVKIYDFEEYGDHRPVLDTGLAPVMYTVGNWEDISKIDVKSVKPQQIDVEGLVGALNQHGEAKLSDHAMPDYSELIFSSFGKPLTANDGKHSLRIKNIDGAKRTVIADVNTASVGGENLTMSFDEIADILNSDNWEEAKPNPSGNKLVTDERYAELRERMRKKLGGQMNIGIDPEILAIGTEMAVYHIEKGARKFIDFAKGMIEDLGDMIRPYLKAFYNGARELPEVAESGLADEMTPYDEVRTFDLSNFGKSTPDAFATAEHVVKEQEVAKQVEVAQERIKKVRQKPKKSKKQPSPATDMGDLFSGLDDDDVSPNDIDNGQRKNTNREVGEGTQHEDIRPAGEPVARNDNSNPSSDKTGSNGTTAKHESAKQVKKPTVKKNTRNNHVERGSSFAPTANGERIKANIAAIRLMKQLTESGKEATKEDMAVLRQFTGWGGLGGFFNNTYSPLYEELASFVTPEELHEAAFSVNSAYYTPVEIIDTLWDIAKNLGFKGGRILEGSAGIGNILGSMPKAMNEASDITAVEIDSLTGNILKLLYPDADVRIEGFQDSDIDNNSIDLAITNVPFVADLSVYDKTEKDLTSRFGGSVQDFCIAKNIRKLKEGGIGIFISAKGSLDSAKSRKLRRWIISEGNSDVIGAFRLNNETFIGTPVTTDIIVVRKRVNGAKSPNAIDVLDTAVERSVTISLGEEFDRKAGKWVKREETYPLDYNKYFIEHPEAMGGVMMYNGERENETYRATSSALWPKDGLDQAKALAKWVKGLRNDGEAAKVSTETVELEKTDGIKEGQIIINSKGEICVSRRGKATPLGVNSTKVKGHSKEEVINDYNRLKKAIDAVLDYQLKNESDKGLQPLLDELNKAYDDFTGKYGNLNKNVAISFLRNDVDYPAVAAIEKYTETETIDGKKSVSVSKTDIFSRRMIGFKAEPTPKDIKDGVIVSMNQFGRIDLGYIADKLGKSDEEVRNSILEERLGFEDPMTGKVEVRYSYLSGNVREKLAYAKSVNKDGKYDKNIEELEKAVPMDIPAHLIEFTIGSTWIDPELYSQFAQETYGVSEVFAPVNIGGLWELTIGNNSGYRYHQNNEKNRAAGVTSKVVHKTVFGDELMLAAMNNKTINFSKVEKDDDGSTRTITDKEASQAATQRIAEIREEFRDWCKAKMLADPELSERMKRIYNDKFNAIVPMSIDDFFLPERFEGTNTAINLYDHQKKAVIRGTMEPLMLAHEVGSGKTFTLISTAMEMRRLGTAKKPMIVVQNATVGQFVSEAKKLYPNAKVLTVSEQDRTREGRTAFYAKIKYNDWDLIIVPQSVFEMIPDSEQRQKEFIQDKIDEKMHIIQMAEAAKLDSNTIRNLKQELEDLQYEFKTGEKPAKKKKKGAKDIAKAEESAAAKAQRQLDRRTDDVSDFDDMGIDALLVDEAHSYKHLGFTTAIERGVKGIDPSYSKKSASVYLKTRAVFDKVGWKNVVFATGTPISNTAAEIWTFMKYLMPREVMEANEIYYFDDFVRNFGSIAQSLEFTTSGKFRENTRFASYVNLPELIRIWASVTDTVLTKDISYVNDKVPAIEGDKAQDIFLPQSDSLVDIMRAVRSELERFEKMSGKEKKENSHIPITMYGIAKRATIDTRLVDANAPDEPLSKTNRAVEEIIKDLKETEAYNGTCAVFCDNSNRWDGEGKRTLGFNLFQEIKRKLIDRGVPESQIIVIESGMTVAQKEKIFAKANAGEIRVIMGSTSTLGTGVNIQERLHMLIHMDAPDRPMDYTQRNGRILRQGNLHKPWDKPVKILRFGVEDSLDVTSYQRLKTKAGFIDSVMDGKPLIANGMENRVLEESEEGLFDNPVAVLSGSEYVLLKSAAERELRKYLNKKQQYELDQIYIENALKANAERIKNDRGLIADFTKRLKTIRTLFPDGKPKHITIEGQKAKWDAKEQIESILKEFVNKPLNAYVERGRKNSYYKGENIPIRISVDDMSILVTVEITRTAEWDYKLGGQRISMHKKISYSCYEIGIEDRPVSGGDVKAVIEDLRTNILTGKYAEDRIASLTAAIERMESDNALMQERRGKPFADAERLKEAQAKVDDYTEKMKTEMAEKEAKYASRGTGEATTVSLNDIIEEDNEEDENRYRDGDEEIDDIASDYYELIDDLFNGVEGLSEKYQMRYFDVATTPDFYKAIGISGDKFTVKYGTISSHFKKDADHTMTKEAWDSLPQALAHPIFITQYGNKSNKFRIYTSIKVGNRYVIVGVDVIKSNQGKDKPMIEINSIRTVFAAKRISDNETLVCYNNAITPEQEALLNGRNFRQYPTIQELSGDKVSDNSDKNNTVIDDGENVYRIREDEPPVNTGIGYKVFYLKDGKLYPPMVANPDGSDTPTGVWLDADAAPVSGQSKTGRPQVKAGGKGTQGGSGQLSYRPGWHLGEIPYALQFNRLDSETGERELFPKDFVWAEVEYANDVNYQQEAMSYGYTENGNFRHSYAGLPRVPENGAYTYRTNPNPETDPWIITGAMKVNRLLTPTEVDEMVREAGREPQKRQKGAITDEQIVKLNEDISRRNQDSSDSMRQAAENLAESLGIKVYIVTDTNELTSDNARKQKRMRNSKGWMNTTTGEIVVVLPNNHSVADIEATILHEIVGHKGLREVVGKDNFNAFLDKVFHKAAKETRAKIVELSKSRNWDFRLATEEYIARLAEEGFRSRENRNLWNTIRDFFTDMFSKAKIALGFHISDNDLRYMLWRSYQMQQSKGAMGVAEDVVMKQKLGVGDFRHRDGGPAPTSSGLARSIYEDAVRITDSEGKKSRKANIAHRLRESYQDSMLALKKLQEAILAETGKTISANENAYIAENRMSSQNKGQAEIYMRDFYKPLQEAVSELVKQGAAYNDIIKYLIAKHGLERNLAFSKRDAEADGGTWDGSVGRDYSGLTDLTGSKDNFTDLAEDIVTSFENSFDTTNLWARINAATKETLRKSYESGLMTKETYEKVRDMFQNYIPLRGWDADVAASEYEYLSSNRPMLSPALKTAEGRKSIADDPIATIGHMAESSIIQGNRNVMKQKLLNFVLNNPTSLATISEQWYVLDLATGNWEARNPVIPEDATADEVAVIVEQFEADMEALKATKQATKVRDGLKLGKHATTYEGQEHCIRVKRGGKEFCIYINGNPRAAQAVNGMTNPDSSDSSLYKAAKAVKNFMARMFTSQNPAFVITNLCRDVIWAGTAVAVKEDKAYAAQYAKNIAGAFVKAKLPVLLQKFRKGTLDMSNDVERYFEEFIKNGGETGFTELNTVEDYKRDIERFLKEANRNGVSSLPKKAWRGLWGCIEFMNRCAEDTTRFMVYMTSRQMGRSVADSVYDAKEITVNFNKKGSGGFGASVMNFAYIFFNATVQGLANFGKMMYHHPVKTTAALSSFTMAGMLVPLLAAAMQAMFGDDDENSYWDLPEWVRRNNLVFFVPRSGNGYLTIPLPHELRPFFGMGELAFSCLAGKEDVEDAIAKGVQGFSGLLPLDYTGNAGNIAVNFTPTIAQPFAQLVVNKDYFGKPIYKKNDYNELDPEWTKAYKGTNAWLVNATKWLNEATGGDNVKSGLIDLNPAQIEHLFESYLGGVGKTLNKGAKTFSMLWDEDMREWRNVPVASSFYQEAEERTTGSQMNREYFDYKEEHDEIEHRISGYKKQVRMGAMEYAEVLNDFIQSPEFKRYAKLKGYVNAVSKMNSKLKYADKTQREEIEQRIAEVKQQLVSELHEDEE